MAQPDPLTIDEPTPEAVMRGVAVVAPDEAPEVLRAEVRRRVAALQEFMAGAPDPAEAERQLAEVDVERVLALIGPARTAIALAAAAIAELGATAKTIADVVRWMDVFPVGLNGAQAYLGIDIAYIVGFRALTRDQRWLLHTLAAWAPGATISREHALTVARGSGRFAGTTATADDLARLAALGFVTPEDGPEDGVTPRAARLRLLIDPYVRFIAGQGLSSWPMAAEAQGVPGDAVVALTLVNWAVSFAEVIAGPDFTPQDEDADEPDAEDEEIEAPARLLTPDPDLAPLTDDEVWAALRPEAAHVVRATRLARELDATEYVFRLCQVLPPRLRARREPLALELRRVVLENGLILARAGKAHAEILLLATQLTDVALDAGDLTRAAIFAQEALDAALAQKDLRAIAFATRRRAALAIRQGDREPALELARQAVRVSRATNDPAAFKESIALLDAATRLGS